MILYPSLFLPFPVFFISFCSCFCLLSHSFCLNNFLWYSSCCRSIGNSFMLFSLKKTFIFHFWKIFLVSIEFWVDSFVCFLWTVLKNWFSCLLAYIFSEEMSYINFYLCFYICVVSIFFGCPHNFIFIFLLISLNIMCLSLVCSFRCLFVHYLFLAYILVVLSWTLLYLIILGFQFHICYTILC